MGHARREKIVLSSFFNNIQMIKTYCILSGSDNNTPSRSLRAATYYVTGDTKLNAINLEKQSLSLTQDA